MKTKSPHGAPLGNRNAWKHGFYSSVFKARERQLLSRLPLTDLAAEIELIRVASLRFMEALNKSDRSFDVETQLAALRAVNLSAQSITSLIRAQALTDLTDDTDRLTDLLDRLESGRAHALPTPPEAE